MSNTLPLDDYRQAKEHISMFSPEDQRNILRSYFDTFREIPGVDPYWFDDHYEGEHASYRDYAEYLVEYVFLPIPKDAGPYVTYDVAALARDLECDGYYLDEDAYPAIMWRM